MTREEFDKTRWGAGMQCMVHDFGIHDIVTVSFGEALIGVVQDRGNYHDADEVSWFRCESVEIVK